VLPKDKVTQCLAHAETSFSQTRKVNQTTRFFVGMLPTIILGQKNRCCIWIYTADL